MEYKSQFTSNLEEVIRSVQLDQRKKSSATAASSTSVNKSSSSSKTDVSSNNVDEDNNKDNTATTAAGATWTAREATDTAIDEVDDEGRGGDSRRSRSRGSRSRCRVSDDTKYCRKQIL